MRISVSTLLFATAVVAAPAADILAKRAAVLAQGTAGIPPNVTDQGDGLYYAVFNEATTAMDVVFTPMAELDTPTAPTPLEKRSTHNLAKRSTTCSGKFSSDTPTLDRANIQLANNANGRTYNYKNWGWVHLGQETSFFCSYDNGQYLLYQLIIDMETVVSQVCGGSNAYGYDRRFMGGGAKDLTVGRTWRGDKFCDNRFHQ